MARLIKLCSYRRREGRDVWHWRTDCRWWPRDRFIERMAERRPSGDACNECRVKDRRTRDAPPAPVE